MKKLTLALAALLAASCATSAGAAMFTDFENYKSFEEGDNPAYTLNDPADYWDGAWNSSDENGDELMAEITEGVGFNGSKGLVVSSSGVNNAGLYLFATDANGIVKDHTGAAYLRVWADFSEVEFRKGNFGVMDSTYSLFTTDEVDNAWECKFYYSEDGANWTEMKHGSDGCFGDAQESPMLGLKGWFAFPVADFTIRENANWELYDTLTPANAADVVGVYLFWDYSDGGAYAGTPFVLDNVEFVADYTVFDYALTAEEAAPAETVEEVPVADTEEAAPVEEEIPAEEETVEEAPAEEVPAEEVEEAPATAVVTEAPQTFDPAAAAAIAAVLSGAGLAIGKKRR